MLNVNTGSPAWEYRSLGGLQWRDRPTVVGTNSKVYVIGGNVPSGSSQAPGGSELVVTNTGPVVPPYEVEAAVRSRAWCAGKRGGRFPTQQGPDGGAQGAPPAV